MMLSEDSVRNAASALVICGAAGSSLETLFREKMKAMADSTGNDVLEALGVLKVGEGPEGIARAHEAVTASVMSFIREQRRLFKSLSEVASKEFRSRRGGDAGGIQGDDATAIHAKLKATQQAAIDWERSVSQYFSCFEDTGRTLAAVLTALREMAERESSTSSQTTSTAEVKKSVNRILRRIDASSILENIGKCKTCSKKFDDRIEKAAEEEREKERAAEEEEKKAAKKGGWFGARRRREEEEEERENEREKKRIAERAAARSGRSKLGGKVSQYEMLTAIREASSTLQDSVVDYFHLTQAIWESFHAVGVKCEQNSIVELRKRSNKAEKGAAKKKSKHDTDMSMSSSKAAKTASLKGGAGKAGKGGSMKALENMLNDLEEEEATTMKFRGNGNIATDFDAMSLSSEEEDNEEEEEDEEEEDDDDSGRIERSPAGLQREHPEASDIRNEAEANPFGQVDFDDDSDSDIAPPSVEPVSRDVVGYDDDSGEDSDTDRKSTPASYENPFGAGDVKNYDDGNDDDDDDDDDASAPEYENPFASTAIRSPSRKSAASDNPFGNIDDDDSDSDIDVPRATNGAVAAAGAVLSTPFGEIETSPRPLSVDVNDDDDGGDDDDDDAGAQKKKKKNKNKKKGKKKDTEATDASDDDTTSPKKKKDGKKKKKKKKMKQNGKKGKKAEESGDEDGGRSDENEDGEDLDIGRGTRAASSKSVYRHPLDEEEGEDEGEDEERADEQYPRRTTTKEAKAPSPTKKGTKKGSARSVLFETPESDDDDDDFGLGGGELEIPDPLAPPSPRAPQSPLKLDKPQKRAKRSICSIL